MRVAGNVGEGWMRRWKWWWTGGGIEEAGTKRTGWQGLTVDVVSWNSVRDQVLL